MLKVVMLAPYPLDERFTHGGVQRVTRSLVHGFRARTDVELHVVSLSPVHQTVLSRSESVWVHHVPAQRRFCLPTFSVLSVIRARRAIRRINPELIHCQESGVEAYIAAGLPYPIVVTVHAIFRNEAKHYAGWHHRIRYGQIELQHRLAARRVSMYVPSSCYARDEMRRHGATLWDVIENPIEDKFFRIPNRAKPGRILFTGTIYPRKGILDLIVACRHLRERGVPFQLHVCGEVRDPEYYRQLQVEAVSGAQGDDVRFMGLVSEDDLEREYSEAAVIVLPSYAETSPMAVQQAMAAGKAVVATRVGGVPYLIEDGENGLLVEPGDIPGLANALQQLITKPEWGTRMGDDSRQRAKSRFSTPLVVAKTIEMYGHLLGKADGR